MKGSKTPKPKTAPRQLAHMVYFRLADRSPGTLRTFLEFCRHYLSKHKGQKHFSLGVRAVEMKRDVNAQDYDVAMNMIFDSIDSYDVYRQAQRHLDFITETAGMSTARRVYDSYLERLPAASQKRLKPKGAKS